MIEIRALGPPLITRGGQPISLQPKRVALLMYLALAERAGMQRRDTLLGVFWPEQDATHARGSLRQALRGIRQTLGDEVLVTRGDEEVGVSHDRLATDVHAFERALDGKTDDAIDLYSAPFCQGFHLSGCPEFDSWIETERHRLAHAFADVVEQTALTAAAAGDHDEAARRWRRLVLVDPYGANAMIGLMNALAATGDRAAALEQFERYADRLRRDLEVEPEADVVVVAKHLKAGTTQSVATAGPPSANRQSASVSVHAVARRSRLPVFSVAAVLLVTAIGGGIFGWPAAAPSDAVAEPFDANSIAVLPFTDMSGDQDQEYMSDGIAEELVNLLARIPELRVISRTSAFSFKGQDIDIPTVAARLNVAHVVEGSVRKAGNTIRITAQLIETQSDRHLWSQTYDRALDDIFGIQDEISAAIVEALKANLGLETPPVSERARS